MGHCWFWTEVKVIRYDRFLGKISVVRPYKAESNLEDQENLTWLLIPLNLRQTDLNAPFEFTAVCQGLEKLNNRVAEEHWEEFEKVSEAAWIDTLNIIN